MHLGTLSTSEVQGKGGITSALRKSKENKAECYGILRHFTFLLYQLLLLKRSLDTQFELALDR